MSDPRSSNSNIHSDNTLTNQGYPSRQPRKDCEECKRNDEYIKVLKNALREVLEQNDALRSRVAELEALISQSEDELTNKNELILQLQATLKEAQETSTSRIVENVKSDEP